MMNTLEYLMNAYFYQDWQSEYSCDEVSDKHVLSRFVENEGVSITTKLVQDINYILNHDLADKFFKLNKFDFDPLLNGCKSESEWLETAYEFLTIK